MSSRNGFVALIRFVPAVAIAPSIQHRHTVAEWHRTSCDERWKLENPSVARDRGNQKTGRHIVQIRAGWRRYKIVDGRTLVRSNMNFNRADPLSPEVPVATDRTP